MPKLKALGKTLAVLLTGVFIGWSLNGQYDSPIHGKPTLVSFERTAIASTGESIVLPPRTARPYQLPVADDSALPSDKRFRQLLQRGEFEGALSYYEQALALDESYRGILDPGLHQYLGDCLQRCAEGAFIELVELWLDVYYDDIPVLLFLSENQRLYGLPEEAASTLHLAWTYALQPGQRENVRAALARLVAITDADLAEQKNWIELVAFYEYLQAIDLNTPDFALRQATLYQTIGEPRRSREMLLALQKGDQNENPQWSAKLDALLENSSPASATSSSMAYEIPVTRRGDHFLVDTWLNGTDQVTLMIDTGATLTTLSQGSFERIASNKLEYKGSRLFNTANGRVKGEVYGGSRLTLGETQVDDLDIAVLDYESPEDVDGVLGMNVLRHYRFEIDQDRNRLYLQPR